MRQLQRPDAPPVLDELTRRGASWLHVAFDEKEAIRRPLNVMSTRGGKVFCNYCESAIQPPKGHIEHLAARTSYPTLEFEWSNLFLSCDSNAHCGHFKDSPRGVAYSPSQVIHPDIDRPDDFLQYFSSGEVQPRQGVDPDSEARALITIQALNLNEPDLVQARAGLARQAEAMVFSYLDSIEQLTPAERAELFEQEIADFEGSPFLTTVRHFFIEG